MAPAATRHIRMARRMTASLFTKCSLTTICREPAASGSQPSLLVFPKPPQDGVPGLERHNGAAAVSQLGIHLVQPVLATAFVFELIDGGDQDRFPFPLVRELDPPRMLRCRFQGT